MRNLVGWSWRCAVVRGPSMSPALSDGDVLLLSLRARPRPGSIVLVQWPQRPTQLSVKRAVGRHGPTTTTWWVQGDNPSASTDSRHLGPTHPLAVVIARLWPRPRIQRAQRGHWRPDIPAQPAEREVAARSSA